MSENAATPTRPAAPPPEPSLKETFGLTRYAFTQSKAIFLACAVGMTAVGGVMHWTQPESPAPAASLETMDSKQSSSLQRNASEISPLLANSFSQSSGTVTETTREETSESSNSIPSPETLDSFSLSPLFLKGGLGMFMGFAIGFAVRAFIRLATIIAGIYFAGIMAMSYAGWIEIHWDVMNEQFNLFAQNIGAQFESAKTFLTGSIPASGATAAGLAMGLRRR